MVIGIIAILAALLFPVFISAKAAAQKTECMSNIGQLSKAIITYAVDYQGRIPDWISPNGVVWDKAIWHHVRNKSVFTCPVNRINPWTHQPWPADVVVRSYCMAKNVARQIVD